MGKHSVSVLRALKGQGACTCCYAVAFPVVLMASVREDVELVPALKQVLLPEELQLVQQQPHPGTAVLQAMGMCIRASAAKDIEKLRMDESVSALQVSVA